MPEGHTLHRLARLHQRRFGRAPVRIGSPQGRFADGATLVDGRVLRKADAYGKHLFHHYDGRRVVHIHLGLYGTFRDFDGSFSFDAANPAASQVQVSIRTASLDSNHAERDKHLRSADFLNVGAHPVATFKAKAVKPTGERTFDITGDLSLNGVTRPVTIQAGFIGEGKDPWGGYRAGFEGTTRLKLKDFAIATDLGPASQEVELTLSVEGVRQ